MSDFLDGLLQRNFQPAGPPQGVQPRPLARFETPDGAAWLNSPTDGPETPVGETPTPPVIPAPVGEQVEPQPVDGPSLLTILERETRLVQERLTEPREPGRTEPALSHLDLLIIPTEPPGEDDNRARPIEPDRRPAEPVRPRAEQAENPVIRAEAVRPLLRGELDALQQQGPEDRLLPPAPGPVVRVTIGRIEVSGPASDPPQPRPVAQNPAPRRTPRPAQPVRSLDDYLRQRNERRK